MNKTTRPKIRVISAILVLFALFLFVSPALAEDNSGLKTVRTAVTDGSLFIETDESGTPASGYAYEYLETLAAYAGWKVEYVPARGFADCLDKLISGEIDLYYDVSYTPEREKTMLFVEKAMGSEAYCLYSLDDDDTVYNGDYSSLSGKRVGVTKGTSQIAALEAWCKENNVDLTFVEYATVPEKEAALFAGDIDLNYEVNLVAQNRYYIAAEIGSSDYYLVVNKDREDIYEDITLAEHKILNTDRYFFEDLNRNYFGATVISRTLTSDERDWLASKSRITVGYFDDYLPFSDKDDSGEVTGLVKDIVPMLFENLHLAEPVEISYVGFADNEDIYRALEDGSIDMAFPVYGSTAFAKAKGAAYTSKVIGISVDLIYADEYTDNTTKIIAVNKNNQLQDYYTKTYYPEAQIVYYDTIEECLSAVADGKAGTTILNGLRTAELLRKADNNRLKEIRLAEEVDLCFAVKSGSNELYSILNRGIANTNESDAVTSSYHYVGKISGYTAEDFLNDNIWYLILGIIILAAVVALTVNSVNNTRLARANKELLAEQERSAEEMKIISGLAQDFASLYKFNLDSGEYRIYHFKNVLSDIKPVLEQNADFNHVMREYADKFIHPEDKAAYLAFVRPANVKQMLAHKKSDRFTFRRNIDGNWLWMEVLYVKTDDINAEAENIVAAFAIRDEEIKENMRQKAALEEAVAEAESANKAKTTFLFNMSHDIRTPMNAILGFTNMALKHSDDREKVKDCLEKTKQSGNLLLSLINGVLDMSRIESGHAVLHETKGDVLLSFANMQSIMEELAKAKNIRLDFAFANIRDRFVYADFDRASRVFINIISNAVKYTKEGGFVHVRCEQTASENGVGTYCYTFEDNGIGMSDEFQKHVFEEFSREESATVSGIQGTGLGLAVCQSFVSLMHGTIACKSKQGAGTTFTVTLPMRLQTGADLEESKAASERAADAAKDGAAHFFDFSGMRVLLVEDNEMNREIAEDILHDEGIVVESACDGSAAVKMVQEKGAFWYDFILTDIQMPVMNGYEAAREIRKIEGCAGLPIIAVSANAFAEDKKASLDAGMDGHIAKPIDAGELMRCMAGLAKRKKAGEKER